MSLVRYMAAFDWRPVYSLTCSDAQHINSKELRAAKIYLRRRLARTECRRAGGIKVLLAIDSRVAVGALAHGRSPSGPVNRVLRSLIPDLLAANAYYIPIWVPSEANPADAPSRHRPLWTWRASLKTHLKRLAPHSRLRRRDRRPGLRDADNADPRAASRPGHRHEDHGLSLPPGVGSLQ